jgi:hypothetical protein
MLVIGTGLAPVFHSVTTTVEDDVAPTPVVGNVRPAQVMTNGDGVTVEGVVDGVLLEQPAASTATSIT